MQSEADQRQTGRLPLRLLSKTRLYLTMPCSKSEELEVSSSRGNGFIGQYGTANGSEERISYQSRDRRSRTGRPQDDRHDRRADRFPEERIIIMQNVSALDAVLAGCDMTSIALPNRGQDA